MSRTPYRPRRSPRIFIILGLATILGGTGFLMFSPLPAPTHLIEKPLDNARFLQ